MSGVLARYPAIKFVAVESGIGWVPFMLETMDYQFEGNSLGEEHPEFDLLQSEYSLGMFTPVTGSNKRRHAD